jgi:hypothetical protein
VLGPVNLRDWAVPARASKEDERKVDVCISANIVGSNYYQ